MTSIQVVIIHTYGGESSKPKDIKYIFKITLGRAKNLENRLNIEIALFSAPKINEGISNFLPNF
jgi:hypothetical protein